MRDKAHYLDMMDRNPNASVGVNLAAEAVLAACGWNPDNWGEAGKIARGLRKLYGKTMTPDQVREEMEAPAHWKCEASN